MFTFTFDGSVFDPTGQPLFLDVTGEIQEKPRLDHTIERKGWFVKANGLTPVQSGVQCELHVDDGRKAPIRITQVTSGSPITQLSHILRDAIENQQAYTVTTTLGKTDGEPDGSIDMLIKIHAPEKPKDR